MGVGLFVIQYNKNFAVFRSSQIRAKVYFYLYFFYKLHVFELMGVTHDDRYLITLVYG